MTRSLAVIAVALSVALAALPTPRSSAQPAKLAKPTGTSYAFLVAPADYDPNELRKLPFSMKETEEFRKVLAATGFDEKNIKFLHDGQAGDKGEGRRYLPEKKKIVVEFELLLSRVGPDDTVLVLLNGHGVHFTGDKVGYFCPVDAKLTDKDTLWAMDGPGGVFDMLKGCKAKRKLLLVNACRNDPATDRSLAGNKIKLDDEDKDEVPEGIAALYSCKPGQKSYYYDPAEPKSKGRERSLFMHHLMEAWSKAGKTTVEDVFKAVRENAAADADNLFGRVQTPVVKREYKGDGEWLVAARDLASVGEPKAGEVRKFEIADKVFMEFCWVPAGEAQLGSPKAERDAVLKLFKAEKEPDWLVGEAEGKRGKFKTKGFWLGKYEVTQAEWTAVMGKNPSYLDGKQDNKAKGMDTSRFPVEQVSWDDCQKFLEAVNKRAGVAKVFGKAGKFQLPHEDEWEYACRGGKGNGRTFYWGDELNGTQANMDGNYPFGTDKNGQDLERTCAVDDTNGGKYETHPWGLCHMHGNVFEWCDNLYDKTTTRVLRGGSWDDYGYHCRAADRSGNAPGRANLSIGLRVCFPGLL